VVFKHFPLSFHQQAMPAAEAAEAAREQGKFWEMEAKIFANQRELSAANFEKWAQEIGLDMARFKSAMETHKWKSRIEEDVRIGTAAGVDGTPSIYVNNVKVNFNGAPSVMAAVDAELQKTARK
jgi:protein-disulfide isomerase